MKTKLLFSVFILFGISLNAQWTKLSEVNGLSQSLCVHNDILVMGVSPGGIFYSTDDGESWIKSASDNTGGFGALTITSDGINLYAARGTGRVSKSTDNGVNWIAANNGLPFNGNIWTVFSNGSKVFAGAIGGIYVSTNGGDSWSKSDSGITGSYTFSVISGIGDTLFAGIGSPSGITGGKVFRSFDGGISWTDVSPLSYTVNVDVNAILITDSIVLLGAQDWNTGILHSTDWGNSWSFYSSGNPDLEQGAAWSFTKVDSFLYVGMGNSGFGIGGIYRRTKYTPWVNVSNKQMIISLPPVSPDTAYTYINTLAEKDGNLFTAVSTNGLFRSADKGDTWTELLNDISNSSQERLALEKHNSNLYAGGLSAGVFVSTNNGNTWKKYLTNVGSASITSFTFLNDAVFLGQNFNDGVKRSTDGGQVWEPVNNGLSNSWINKLAAGDNIIYAGTRGGVFSSTNMGGNWINTGWGNVEVIGLYADENIVIASRMNEVFRSTDSGLSWSQLMGDIPTDVYSFTAINNTIFMGGSGTVKAASSKDNGTTWNNITGNLPSPVFAMASSGDTLYAATETIVYYTTDFQNWIIIPNDGLGSNIRFRALMASNGYIYCGMGSGMGGAFRRNMSGTTSVENINTEVPDKFLLEQNYPNPFNPSTKLSFAINHSSFVSLKVYDVLGNEVSVLINEEKPAGSYEITFNASGLSSGIYFYRLTAGKNISTRKMLLVK